MNIFEKASRTGLRFTTSKGNITTEDLWSLPLTSPRGNVNLDDIAKGVNRELQTAQEESFVTETSSSPTNELRLEIVKHIIAVRLAERDAAKDQKAKADQKQRLMDAIDRAENRELETKTPEQLRAELAAL